MRITFSPFSQIATLLLSFEKQNVILRIPDSVIIFFIFLFSVSMKAIAVLKSQGAVNLPA